MKSVLAALCVFVVLSASLSAQTFNPKAQWTMAEAPAVAQAFVYTLKVGATPVPIGPVSCAAVGTPAVTTCSAALSAPLASGSYTLTAANAFGSSLPSDPFVGSAPGKPLTITIVVTITIP
jgi:hypothetical protein